MSNEHIARRGAIGLGKESTPGTAVSAGFWFPKLGGGLEPNFEKALDDSGYGVIDEVADSQTVKNMTTANIEGTLRDVSLGHFLHGAIGQSVKVKCITITGQSGGTPARGDQISSAAGSWAATIRKVLIISATTYYFVEETSGTVDAQTDVTNGTWTGGTSAIINGVEGHFFSRLNNNEHPTYTIYESNPIGDERAPYCMINSLDVEIAVGEFGTLNAEFMGKQIESTGAQTPAYTEQTPFLAKHAEVKFAADESGLNAASASSVTRFRFGVQKNLTDIQAFGSTDIDTLHNQQFTINGDLEATYNANTYRDLVANSTKQACRLSAVNTEVTALNGSIYPGVYIDMAQLSFEEWSKTTENNDIVRQTMGFVGEYDTTTAMTCEILLLNGEATAY